MKKQNLMATALAVAIFSTNTYAADLNVSTGDNIKNPNTGMPGYKHPTYNSINVDGGQLTIEDYKVIATDNLTINGGNVNVIGDGGLRSEGTLNLSGGKITGSNNTEIRGNTVNISGDTLIDLSKGTHLVGYSEVHISGGTLNLSNTDFSTTPRNGSASGNEIFEMTGGVINMDNSSIGNLKDDNNSEVYNPEKPVPGATKLLGGTINVNSGKNEIMANSVDVGNTINIKEGSMLEAYRNYKVIFDSDSPNLNENVEFFDKSDIKTTTSGIINLGGTLVSDVSGQGTLAITSKNAVLDGNVSGVNVDVKSNISMANTFKGSLSANKTTIYDGSSLDLGIKTLQTISLDVKDNGTLAFQVSGKNDGEYGKVKANSINISNVGTKLNLTLDNGVLAKDETKTFTILDSSNITGSFAELSKNSRYEFIDNGNGTFNITGKATAGDVAEDAGADDHKSVASAWLDGVEISENPQAENVVNILNTLSQTNPKEFVKALKTLAPVVAPMTHSSSQSQNQQLFNVVAGRMDSGSMGMSGGDTFEKVGVWAQGLYNKTKYDVSDGFDGKSQGIVLGADAYITDNTKLGLGFAYTKSDIDAIGRDVDVDNYSIFLYGEQLFDKLYINSALNYNFSKYDEAKNIAGVGMKGDYNANSIGAQVLTGYRFNNGFSPEGGFRYAWTHQGSYTDTVGQHMKSTNSNTLTALLGGRYLHNFKNKGFNIVPEIGVMLTYDVARSNDSSVVSLPNGSLYEISGDELERFGGELSLKLGFEINDFEISLKYEGQYKKDFTNNSGIINFRYNF